MANVVETVKAVLTPELTDKGFDLWDVLYEKQGPDMVLRVLVDRIEGAVTMDDLVMLTELIGERLDDIQPDPFPEAYLMDVSSPGAERELQTQHDFNWALGKYVHLEFYQPADYEELDGELAAVDEDKLTIAVAIKGKRTLFVQPLSTIKHARLAINQTRVLKTAEDFAWAMHKLVHVSTYQKIDGKKDFAGELTAVTDDDLTLVLEDDIEVVVPRTAVAQARQANNF